MKNLEKFLQKNWYWLVPGVFILSLGIRLVYVFYVRGQAAVWEGDEGFFGQIAENIVQGHGYLYRGSFYTSRMPLMPIVTALFSFLTGGFSIVKAHIFGALLGSLIPLAAIFCAWTLTQSALVALGAGVYTALYPFFIHEASFLDTENLFIPLFLVYVAVLYRLKQTASVRDFILPGILLGLMTLTRPTLSLFLGFYAVYLLLQKWSLQKIMLNVLVQGVCLVLLLAPWSYALSQHVGKLCVLTSGTNAAMIGGTNPVVLFDKNAAGEWVNLGRDFPEVEKQIEVLAPGKSEFGKVLVIMQTYPTESVLLMGQKLKKLWGYSPKHYSNRNMRDDVIGFLAYGLLLPFVFIALVERKHSGVVDIFWIFAAYFSFMTLLTSGTMRFRLPLDALMIIMVLHYLLVVKGKKKYV